MESIDKMISGDCRFLLLALVSCLFVLSGCTSSAPESKPMPELTFTHLDRMAVQVASVKVDNNYHQGSDKRDVSSSFPTPPDILLRRYAENKFQPSSSTGTLKFVIDGANIHHSLVQPQGKFSGWMGIGRKDLYEVTMRIKMFVEDSTGAEGTHSILNMRRSIAIPQRYSVAEKEQEKFRFLELLMDDVDQAVTRTIHEKMDIAI